MHRRRFFCAAFGCVATLHGSKPAARVLNELIVPDSEYEVAIEKEFEMLKKYVPNAQLTDERKAELVNRERQKFSRDASVAAATGVYFSIMALPIVK